jgi:flagellar operon protein
MNAIHGIRSEQAGVVKGGTQRTATASGNGVSFAHVLDKKVNELRFSAHAQTRIRSRNIDCSPQMMDKLTNAVDSAQSKGSKNSLVLFNNAAFIVNVPTRTVVTAMDGENIRENIFTNIDSTVLAG